MFKKSKQAKQQRMTDRAAFRQGVEHSIEEALKLEDAAQKVLELNKIRKSISAEVTYESKICNKNKSLGRTVLGGTGTIAIAAGATAVPTAGLSLAFAVPALMANAIGSAIYVNSLEKKLRKESKEHLDTISGRRYDITDLMEDIVADNVSEIAQSPDRDKVLGISGMSSIFSAAAARHIEAEEAARKEAEAKAAAEQEAAGQEAAPEAVKATAPRAKKPAAAATDADKPAAPAKRPRQKPNYDKLKKAL